MNQLEQLWQKLLVEDHGAAACLVDRNGTWDDPLFGRFEGDAVGSNGIPELGSWYRSKAVGGTDAIKHLRTTSNDRRVVVESVLPLKDGLVWNPLTRRAEPAERFELAVAVVADRISGGSAPYGAIRIYFGTWSVMSGSPKARIGPIAPDERASAAEVIASNLTLTRYYECLAKGDLAIVDEFEPDGYFREPANNFACGRDQLLAQMGSMLKQGGIGLEHLTATSQHGPSPPAQRFAIELQTAAWGTKRMDQPQAGFACYEIGEHGKLKAARVYDSVVPPEP